MAEQESFPLLRGTVSREEFYRSPLGGSKGAPKLPKRIVKAHAQALLQQLDEIVARADRPPGARDEEAHREIIAFQAEKGFTLEPERLASGKADARLVSFDDTRGLALIDTPSAQLNHIRSKITAYASDAKVTGKGARKNEIGVAPISEARLATVGDRAGPRVLRAKLKKDVSYWFELSCRGGTRLPDAETDQSRREIARTLESLGSAEFQEFVATERLLVFARLTPPEMGAVLARTDCIYEFELAGEDVRAWLLITRTPSLALELQGFRLEPPGMDAPSVVVLDSGIVSGHPMLNGAILSAQTAVPGVTPEDVIGHGTAMAGIALYEDVGSAAEIGAGAPEYWVQNVKILHEQGTGTAADDHRQFWPAITRDAIALAEQDARPRVFSKAVTAEMDDPPGHTSWSQAIDQLAFNGGRGRLIVVSIGNVDPGDHWSLAQGYPTLNLNQRIDDPAQATNALTVGACTHKTTLPPDPDYEGMSCVAPAGGISIFTRSGLRGADADALKPDVVFEGGNAAEDGTMIHADLDTLGELSTGHEFLMRPLVVHSMTSLATAHAARFAVRLFARYPDLRPETVRGLIVHSASWTVSMLEQFPNIDERISICGYGLPDFRLASECLRERATVIVEDRIPNAVFETDGKIERKRRLAKFFRLPVPEEALVNAGEVELRVTLSYFAEPNTSRRKQYRGLDLAWDMQGPSETEDKFRRRVNKLLRDKGVKEQSSGSFDWTVKKQRRSHGTVQGDRWVGDGALLAGNKLIAVYPVLGWWDRRKGLESLEQPFSLLVSVRAKSGIDIYTAISTSLHAVVELPAG